MSTTTWVRDPESVRLAAGGTGCPFFLVIVISGILAAMPAAAQVPGGSPPYGTPVGSGSITAINP